MYMESPRFEGHRGLQYRCYAFPVRTVVVRSELGEFSELAM